MSLFIIFILTTLVLFGIAIFDLETSTIPHTLTILLLALGIIYCCINKDFKAYFTLPLVAVIFILHFVLFIIFGENAIGGGDVKILSISALFLHTFNYIGNYCVYLCLYTLIAFIVAKSKKDTHIKFGPYMALALISTLFNSFYCSFTNILLFDCVFVLGLYIIDLLFFSNRRMIEDAQKNIFPYKK